MSKKYLILLVIPCVIMLWVMMQSVLSSLEAEKTLHASNLVLDVVSEYCAKHPGMWPPSWQALTVVQPARKHGAWNWPKDVDNISERIDINFSLTARDVATSTPANFTAIRQSSPCYPMDENEIEQLICTVKGNSHQGSD